MTEWAKPPKSVSDPWQPLDRIGTLSIVNEWSGKRLVKSYYAIRDWVDRQWRAPGMQFKVLLLPSIIPLIILSMIARTPAFFVPGWAWFGLWNSFVIWRYCVWIREVSRDADRKYDRTGKFSLAREYHDTESATAAAEKERQSR